MERPSRSVVAIDQFSTAAAVEELSFLSWLVGGYSSSDPRTSCG
jgi:hypothetical protein